MCEAWKLLASAVALGTSGFHFWDKYLNVETIEEEKKKEEEKKHKEKPRHPCVQGNCPRPDYCQRAEEKEGDSSSPEKKKVERNSQKELQERCQAYKEKTQERKEKHRQKMKKRIEEAIEAYEKEKKDKSK